MRKHEWVTQFTELSYAYERARNLSKKDGVYTAAVWSPSLDSLWQWRDGKRVRS